MDKLKWAKRTFGLFLVCAATAIALPAQTFTLLYSFGSKSTDGDYPLAAVVQATDGNLYGTTEKGGTHGDGTVFKITPGGTLTTVHSFDLTDGFLPFAGLVEATDGNLYGTTKGGGANGEGTVFKITPRGTLTTLYSFGSQSGDGFGPEGGLIQVANGNLYGTTHDGATVFKITLSGMLTTLNSSLQGYPEGALIQATDGNFYGTTLGDGAVAFGTVFKITPNGTLTILHSFCTQSGCTDGEQPLAGLIQAADGNFYGTTGGDTTIANPGTVFKITPSGTLTTLYRFCSQGGSLCTDGEQPAAPLVQATDGNFYGTTRLGGANGAGAVFKITPGGTLTTLYSLCSQSGCADGSEPVAGLVQDTNGTFYGTTNYGGIEGVDGVGVVFSLSVGLGPFVETLPTSGKAGRVVHILGTNLTGATSVTFNGTAATFTVKSASLITTTVPAGATTGSVQVVTPSGTLSSNVPFRVLP